MVGFLSCVCGDFFAHQIITEGKTVSNEDLDRHLRAATHLSTQIALYRSHTRHNLHADIQAEGYDAAVVLSAHLVDASMLQLLGIRASENVDFYLKRLAHARASLSAVEECRTKGPMPAILWVRILFLASSVIARTYA